MYNFGGIGVCTHVVARAIIARTDLTSQTMRLSINFFAKWEILGIVADAALLSRRADRLTALTLATTVMVSWGWHAPSDGWRYPDSSLRVDLRLRETTSAPEARLVHDLRERTGGRSAPRRTTPRSSATGLAGGLADRIPYWVPRSASQRPHERRHRSPGDEKFCARPKIAVRQLALSPSFPPLARR